MLTSTSALTAPPMAGVAAEAEHRSAGPARQTGTDDSVGKH
jgi:hypothetical protein